MSDEAAFLRAIHAAPADDAPRLVYADWLDERGDPRGRFLRDECTAAAAFRADKPAPANKLRKAAAKVGLEWALSVARPPVGVCTPLQFSKSGKVVTAAELDAGAQRAQIQLPPDYRAFLLLHNGGEPKPNQFEYASNESDGPESVVEFFPFKPRPGFETVTALFGEDNPDAADPLLAIAMPGMEEDCLALSVGDDDFGAVFYQAYIEGLQDPVKIANSFAEFLAMIGDHRPDWVRMAEDGDAVGMAAWLDAGGDPHIRDPQNDFTPLHYAIVAKQVDVVKVILERKPKFTARRASDLRAMIEQYPNRAIRSLILAYLER